MRQENVLAVNGTVVVTDSGPKTPIGDELHQAGDVVWVDGNCVYGHKRKSTAPMMINVEGGELPKRKYTVFAYTADGYIHLVIYDLETFVPIVDIESGIVQGSGGYRFTCSDDCKKLALLLQQTIDNAFSKYGEICQVQEFSLEADKKEYTIEKVIDRYNQIYRFQYDEDKLILKNTVYGRKNSVLIDFNTYTDGAITSTTSLAEKFDEYNTKMLGDVGLAVSVAGGQQSNSGAYSEAYSQAMAAAAANGPDYTATKPSYWVTAGGGAAPTFTISQSDGESENSMHALDFPVINDENLIAQCNTGKYTKVTNGDNFTNTEYGLRFSDTLTAFINESKCVTADLEQMYVSSHSTCFSGVMRTMLESWISYVQNTTTGGLTGESFNIVNSTYSSVNISASPAEDVNKYYTVTNVIALHGGIKLTGNCSLDSSYRQPRINYGTYLVGNKSFPYYPGANYKYFTLKNMFPDAIKIADNRILTLHDLKYCVCDLDTQTVLHTIPYDVLNSTANVFTWGQEEITKAINLFLKTV